MSYFEDNVLSEVELHDLHDNLHKATGIVESNVLFMLTNEPDETRACEVDMCQSCFNAIAVCEAIISKYPDEVAEKALANSAQRDAEAQEEGRPDERPPRDPAWEVLAVNLYPTA